MSNAFDPPAAVAKLISLIGEVESVVERDGRVYLQGWTSADQLVEVDLGLWDGVPGLGALRWRAEMAERAGPRPPGSMIRLAGVSAAEILRQRRLGRRVRLSGARARQLRPPVPRPGRPGGGVPRH